MILFLKADYLENSKMIIDSPHSAKEAKEGVALQPEDYKKLTWVWKDDTSWPAWDQLTLNPAQKFLSNLKRLQNQWKFCSKDK